MICAVEPEMDAAKRPVGEGFELACEFFAVRCRRKVRQQLLHGFKRQGDDEKRRDQRAGAGMDSPLGDFFVPLGRFDAGIQVEFRSFIFQKRRSASVEFAQRY